MEILIQLSLTVVIGILLYMIWVLMAKKVIPLMMMGIVMIVVLQILHVKKIVVKKIV